MVTYGIGKGRNLHRGKAALRELHPAGACSAHGPVGAMCQQPTMLNTTERSS
jgi:hypothetical protein